MKRFNYLMIIVVFTMMIMSLSACGKNVSDSTADEGIHNETTAVFGTTSEGGTVEIDSEGNKITKDNDGNVIKVEDKNGNPIDVTEYLITHSWVTGTGADNTGSSDKSNTSDNFKNNGGKYSSDQQDEEVEGDIPVVIATIPDEEDMIELPDI